MYTSFTDWESGLYLEHHGIKGMKWGERRWQNQDGSLTSAGRQHYGVGEGGNQKMERLYKRQARKLEKLRSRADIEQQAANVKKYNRRAGVAAGVALGSAGLAVGMKYRNGRLKQVAKDAIKGLTDQQDARLSASYKFFDDTLGSLKERAHYQKHGRYSDQAWDKIYKDEADMNATWDRLQGEKDSIRSKFNQGAKVRQAVSTAATGVAAVSVGLSVYNKIQAHVAKKRMSEVGHQKAVQNVKNQMAKMEKMFADTPYSQLVKDQQKQGLERSKKKR